MDKYRKVTQQELELFGFKLPKTNEVQYKNTIDFIKKHYPSTAQSIRFVINSEYNDNTYDNTLKYIVVYNKNGDELLPNKATATECRNKWWELEYPGSNNYESNDVIEDIILPLSISSIPDLYIKVV